MITDAFQISIILCEVYRHRQKQLCENCIRDGILRPIKQCTDHVHGDDKQKHHRCVAEQEA